MALHGAMISAAPSGRPSRPRRPRRRAAESKAVSTVVATVLRERWLTSARPDAPRSTNTCRKVGISQLLALHRLRHRDSRVGMPPDPRRTERTIVYRAVVRSKEVQE